TEAQGPATYTCTVRVTDNGSPALYDEEQITLTVNEVNQAPSLGAIGNRTVQVEETLRFTATATDPDLQPNRLAFSVVGPPVGASIDPLTGEFSWQPSEAGTYAFTVRVTDDGPVNLLDEEAITITVFEVNQPPELAPIGNRSVDEGAPLTFTAT